MSADASSPPSQAPAKAFDAPVSVAPSGTDKTAANTVSADPETGTPAAVVNVWDARKRQLQEKERAREEQRDIAADGPAPRTQSVPTMAQGSSRRQERAEDTVKREPGHHDEDGEDKVRGEDSLQGDTWLQRIQMLNGGEVMPTVHSMGQARQDSNPANGRHTSHHSISSTKSSPSASQTRDDIGPSRTSRVRKKGKAGSPTVPPPVTDAQTWPSPDVAMSGSVKYVSGATEGSSRHDEGDEGMERTRKANVTPTAASLQDLDIELRKQGGDKQRKGKQQWISIVPTITHTAPLPGKAEKKRVSKGSASTGHSVTIPSTTPASPPQRRNQSQSSTLPPSSRSESKSSSPNVCSPLLSERGLLSPAAEVRAVSAPGHSDEKGSGRSSSLAISTRTSREELAVGTRNGSSSPSPMRSPLAQGGSIRGPRFKGEAASSPKSKTRLPKTSSSGGNVTPAEESVGEDSGADAVGQMNALHLSTTSSLPLPEAGSAASQVDQPLLPNDNGSFSPTRGTEGQFLPPPFVDQAWHPQYRGRSRGSSARGARGRGLRRSEVGEGAGTSEAAIRDNEERGLPSDVPSGPRNWSAEAPYRESELGPRPYAQPMGAYPPLPMYMQQSGVYYPPLAGQPTPGLESTPAEFAPQGDIAKAEPSQALLHQIEFYFSHRNLQGDFFLRKNMDEQGYVPIAVVAGFNKVKLMTDRLELIKETLLFSKVLDVDEGRGLVRKAYDWQLYILVDGDKPLEQPHVGPPVAGHYPQAYPTYGPPSSGYYGHPQPNFYFQNSYALPPSQGPAHGYPTFYEAQRRPHNLIDANGDAEDKNVSWIRGRLREAAAHGTLATQGDDEGDGDDDDDEEVLGVVAAEGLGGALRV